MNKKTAWERSKQSIHELTVVCHDYDRVSTSLSTSLKLLVEVVHLAEYCLKTDESSESDLSHSTLTKFVNRDQKQRQHEALFTADYSLTNINTPQTNTRAAAESRPGLDVELLTHRDLMQFDVVPLEQQQPPEDAKKYRLTLSFRSALNSSRLMLGKYTVRVRLRDRKHPSCVRLEQFTLLVGNNLIGEKEIVAYLQTLKQQPQQQQPKKVESKLLNNEFLLSDDEDDDDDDDNNKGAPNESKTLSSSREDESLKRASSKLLKSDYILLFILIVIVVITSILFAFIAILCICSKYKKQFGKAPPHRLGYF